jgi:mRNA interferase RelE/StbE
MSYSITILRKAQKALANLPVNAYERVRDSIRELGNEPRPDGCRKLVGRSGWRIRIGDYRVIYEVDDQQKTVTILSIGHRRDIYK